MSMQAEPIAALGARLLGGGNRAFLATVRQDGRPRVHPVCPVIEDGILLLGITPGSPKDLDLRRDGRYVLHALLGPADAEFWVEGTARLRHPDEFRARIPRGDSVFSLDIVAAHATLYSGGPDGLPLPDRRMWRDVAMAKITRATEAHPA
jgi:hypothetical protein